MPTPGDSPHASRMSINRPTAYRRGTPTSLILFKLGMAVLAFWLAGGAASAQSLDVKIKVVGLSPPRVHVEGRREGGTGAWSFRNFYGSAAGLAERIENFTLTDEGGAVVNSKKVAPG